VSSTPELVPALVGVPRTALWTLYCRAVFAERGVIDDPVAVQIKRDLGADLRRELGPPARSFAERALYFDSELRSFLSRHPGASVVSLGEGLETQRFRVEGYGRWTTVDLPAVLEVRERFIAPDARHVHRPESVTDLAWLDALESRPVFVVAQGLFMYLKPESVKAILEALAGREEVSIIFDVVPPWVWALSRLRPRLGRSMTLPAMQWGASASGLRGRVQDWLGRSVEPALRSIPLPSGPLPGSYWTVAAVLHL